MKYLSLLITIFLLTIKTFEASAQFPAWQWVKNAGSGELTAITSDNQNNIYTTGSFYGKGVFGTDTLVSDTNGTSFDAFVAKYNNSGNLVWVKKSRGISNEYPRAICLDKNGNVFVAGYIEGQNSIFGNDTLKGAGEHDVFIAKYDTAGVLLWAKRAGGTGRDEILSGIVADSSGSVYINGRFTDTAYFDAFSLASQGIYGNFIVKYSSSGNVIWAKKVGGKKQDSGFDIAIDKYNNIYTTGYFQDTAYFGTNMLVSNGSSSAYLLKIDTAGNVRWVKQFGNNSIVNSCLGFRVVCDANGMILLSGSYSDSMHAGNQNLYLPSGQSSGRFLTQYDSNGSVQWLKNMPPTYNYVEPLVADDSGYIYTAGGYDTLVSRYNASGTLLGTQKITGRYSKTSIMNTAICRDESGSIIIGGNFDHSISFGSTTINSANGTVFLAKLPAWTLSVPKPGNNNPPDIGVSPNPANDMLHVSLNGNKYTTLKLYDQLGRMVSHVRTSQTTMQQIDISALSSGIYYLEASGADIAPQVKKVIVQR